MQLLMESESVLAFLLAFELAFLLAFLFELVFEFQLVCWMASELEL